MNITDTAILIIALGEDLSSQILKEMTPQEVNQVAIEMAKIKSVKQQDMDRVLNAFLKEASQKTTIFIDSDSYANSVLTKAFGESKANQIMTNTKAKIPGIDALKWLDVKTISELIQNEHPQIIATILAYLEPDLSSQILKTFTDRLRNDVILRISTLTTIQEKALFELNEALLRIQNGSKNKQQSLGGKSVAASILNLLSADQANSILNYISDADSNLAQEIKDEMFVFEDLNLINDKEFQNLLREINSEGIPLVSILAGASENLKEKVFKNISKRAAESLKEDFDNREKKPKSEIDKVQKDVLKIVQRLISENQINLSSESEKFI